MAKKRLLKKRRIRKVDLPCQFCQTETKLDYKEVDTLARFISERSRIVGRERTGVCYKHQRFLSKAVKRARFLSLLPYVVRPV